MRIRRFGAEDREVVWSTAIRDVPAIRTLLATALEKLG
jgi:hypothetical protein